MKKPTNPFKDFDYPKVIHHLMIGVNFLFMVFLFLNFQEKLPGFWSQNFIYIFFTAVLVNVLFFVSRINRIPESEREKSTLIYFFSHFFLLSLVVIVLNQFLEKEFVLEFMTELTILSIALGFLTFYAYRGKVEREVEEEVERERGAEERRGMRFGMKFSRVSKLNINYGFKKSWKDKNFFLMFMALIFCPFVFLIRLPYKFMKWGYKEGWAFSIPFVLIAIIFIGIKIGMPIVYTGSYVDEYNHIMSGMEFFDKGHFAEVYHGSYYMRGAYVSFLVGLFMYLFGQTIFVAKMLPATIGIINFFLLYAISRKLIKRKPYILLLMLIYTISPWIIFNHFYIRMFVFYELFLLSITLVSLKLIEVIRKRDKNKIWIYSGIFIIINFINYFFSYDSGKYLIFLFSGLFALYLYLFEIKFSKRKKFILLVLGVIILFFLFDVSSKVGFLIDADLQFTSPDNLKYDYYFFNLNLIFSILFISSIALIRKMKSKEFFIISSFLLLFLVHMVSSKDLQLLRGIMYLFPAYYMLSVFSISRIGMKKLSILLVTLMLLVVLINNYPDDYWDGPYIEEEAFYIDYEKAYKYISEKNNGDMIIVSDSAGYSGLFHTSNEIYFLADLNNDRSKSLVERKKIFSKNESEKLYFSMSIPLISKFEKEFIKDRYILVRSSYFLLNKTITSEIEKTHNKKEFNSLIVYEPKY